MIGSGSIIIKSYNSLGKSNKDFEIKVLMIYNNIGNSSKLESKWGLSMIVEKNNDALLFDTGGEPKVLWNNLQTIGFDVSKISDVVISHNHSDHVYGLSAIIEKSNIDPKVYVPEFELEDIKLSFPEANLIGVNDSLQLNEFAWTTGQLHDQFKMNIIYEQSVIITHEDSIFLFTGCSHPGIVKIVEKAKSLFPDKEIGLVAGGFHMLKYKNKMVTDTSEKLRNLGVQNIGPSHCTGDEAMQIFKNEWKDNFIDFNLAQNQITI